MAKYLIPKTSLEKLRKQVIRIKNKGVPIIFELGEEKIVEDENIKGLFHKVVEVEVEGNYKLNNWEFVATIEHTPNGNIIRSITDNYKIPERYKNSGPECEHCNKIRSRKDTYLVYNTKTNEFKQVGRTCLKDYTEGLDANKCAEIAQLFINLEKFEGNYADDFISYSSSTSIMSNDIVKKYAYSLVKDKGYLPKITTSELMDILRGKGKDKLQPANNDKIKEIDDWVETINIDKPGYFRNAVLAWKLEYIEYRHLALICSLINVFFKTESQRAIIKTKKETTSYVGNINDKIDINIKNSRVLYTRDNLQYSYYAPDTYVYEIIDKEGNIYIWNTSQSLEGVTKINATVKEHREYKGIRQTIITRGKIIEVNSEPIDKFLSYDTNETAYLYRDMKGFYFKIGKDYKSEIFRNITNAKSELNSRNFGNYDKVKKYMKKRASLNKEKDEIDSWLDTYINN